MPSQNAVPVQRPPMNEVQSQRPRLAVVPQKPPALGSGAPPIYGVAGPNNAKPSAEDLDYAELGSSSPLPPPLHPQTKRRRLLLGTSSLTRYFKSLGAIKNAVSESDTTPAAREQPAFFDSYDNSSGSGRGAKGVPVQSQLRSGSRSRSRPYHIRLDVDSYAYSRDAVAAQGGANSNQNQNSKSGTGTAYYDENSPRTCSPDEYRRSTSSSTRQVLNRVPEEMEASSLPDADGQERERLQDGTNGERGDIGGGQRYYGSVGRGAPLLEALGEGPRHPGGASADEGDEDSELSEEEEEWLLDEQLAKEGLYRGNYKNLLLLYTLVPLSTILAFVFLALLPVLAFRSPTPSPFPYPPYLPFPLPELLVSTSLWALSYLLRDFLYATSLSSASLVPAPSRRFPTFVPVLTSIFSSVLQSASSLFFRQLAIPILLIPYYSTEHLDSRTQGFAGTLHKRHFPTWQDDAFRRVWWVALGWAAAEAVVGVKQGYESIALYKDVLVTAKKNTAPKAALGGGVGAGDEEDRSDGAASRTPVGRLGAVTPTRSPLSDEDASATPTQRDRQGSFTGKKATPQTSPTVPPQPIKRTHSDSLSSVSSGYHSQYGDHRLVDVVYGEREPLLKVHSHAGLLTQHPVNGGSRLSVEDEVERDLDQLLACRNREELEELYGIPVIRIPVFISCLYRTNSILSSLGICMLLSSAYMRSTFAYTHPSTGLFATDQYPPSNRPLAYTIPSILLIQALLSMMHTPWVLPRIGIQTFVYVGSMISLGLFFGGLGVWEVLT